MPIIHEHDRVRGQRIWAPCPHEPVRGELLSTTIWIQDAPLELTSQPFAAKDEMQPALLQHPQTLRQKSVPLGVRKLDIAVVPGRTGMLLVVAVRRVDADQVEDLVGNL
jgi:hypothetical protein